MKKNLLTVLILALLIVNIVLTSVMLFSVIGTNNKTAALITNIATVMNLELTAPGEAEAEKEISLTDTALYDVSSTMTIPLTMETAEEKQRYIMFNISLSMDTTHEDYESYGATMLERESLIKDAISSAVSAHTENECRNNMEGLKEDILEALQELFQSDFIYKIAISDVKFG